MLLSSVKNFTILPDRVCQLDIRPGDGVTGTLNIQDNSGSASVATALTNLSKKTTRNSIDLKDYLLSNATVGAAETAIIEIEAM